MNFQRIDAHQHFWQYDPARHVWMSDEMDVLKKNFSPDDLAPLLKNCGLDGCVAVQANQAEVENEYLLALADEYDFIKGIVGWVDLRAENLSERLEHYRQFSHIKGFRHVIHDEPEPDFMLQPDFLKGVAALKNFGYTYDILIFAAHLTNTLRFVEALPEQPLVIDHIAKPAIRTGDIATWQKELKAVAAYENVYCKISGMTTETHWKNWQKDDFRKYLDVVTEAFGTQRILYGSDWPVCTLSATYEAQFNIVKDYFSTFSRSEQDRFFGGNAAQFYHL